MNSPTTEALVQKEHLQCRTDERVLPEKYVIDYLGYLTPVNDAHINTRGWVMQERLLSPRALHFGEHQVYWECREKRASETNPNGLEIYGNGVPFKGLAKGPPGVVSWTQLVMAYSKCALSFPSDKLVAFSAIARSYASYLPDEYIAGMWRNHLRNDLLWLAFANTESEHTRYKTYTAPTWSWASINGMVLVPFESDMVEYRYKVDDYKLEYATEDKMGAIRAGWLRLSGQLRPLKLLRKTSNEFASEEENIIWSLVIDNTEYDPSHYIAEEPGGLRLLVVHLDDSQVDIDAENESDSLYCMLATHHLCNEVGDKCNMWDFFLFQLVDATKGTFRRIGLARTRTGDVDNPYPAGKLVHGPSIPPTLLPCAAYEDGIHSIYVI
ncbi:hypothetical protein NW768_007198 [Fusarium equiseti]|uniref:Heterokaryon incompatibility protein n=1 Tax=Fusarium equiseti TaxID=61235 RepID=A0ABQ8RAC7_FUSEQ|nr:hypothetical protein NW768_007198 [Fusarium equiseti]